LGDQLKAQAIAPAICRWQVSIPPLFPRRKDEAGLSARLAHVKEMIMLNERKDIARANYRAYVNKDREAIERLIADDFHFTSPRDNRLNRATYFERCWPISERILDFDFIEVTGHGESVFVTYEGIDNRGHRFRNTERLTIRSGKIVEVEVYFGWSIPHSAPDGGFIDA
jgi:ketosteroid isomerase-like protein